MAGFRANANRCGVSPSLAGGQTHPRGSLVTGAVQVVLSVRQGTGHTLFLILTTTTCPAGPTFSIPRRGAGRYVRGKNGSRRVFRELNSTEVCAADSVDSTQYSETARSNSPAVIELMAPNETNDGAVGQVTNRWQAPHTTREVAISRRRW
jgi:hypothetical protein